ncbi:MAG: radical SAM family heme chaperone HemW [Litorimonas sp.]
MNNGRVDKLAVYIHWPYCARICPYCDFNVYKRREDDTLLPAILADLKHWRELSGPREVTSIHFGGGTPSLMKPAHVSAVIDGVSSLWGVDNIEIALEANPHEMNVQDWRDYASAGLNRLSLGVQSFHDGALSFLGRDHDGETARAALDLAMDTFASVSADLIFGWAGQTKSDLSADLSTLLATGVPHISTYQLTIEDGTAFAKAEGRGQTRAVGSDLSADLYDHVMETFGASGFDHYEVSNFAKPGHRSRHNLAYWQGLDYVGVGPGAHGRITKDSKRNATIAHLTPGTYTKAVAERGSGIDSLEALTGMDWATEYLLMGLRIEDGVSLNRYTQLSGSKLNASELSHLIQDGLLSRQGDTLKATTDGRLVLNAITERLLLS